VYLKGIGHVKVSIHRVVQGRVKTISVKQEGRKWFLLLSCDGVPEVPLRPTGRAVGVDVGIASFLITSDGQHVINPRYGRIGAKRLAEAQRVLAQKKRSSNNRRAVRATVAARHRKVTNQRRDLHHKVARHLVSTYDVICIEDLEIKNMTRSAKGTAEHPGTKVAAKSGLNRSINDAGWGQFSSILRAKAEEAGRVVVNVNPRRTSQTCAECGHVDPASRISQAVFRCRMCDHEAHADVNAARNILRAGLAPPAAEGAA
jgi:putative transposase